jgi:hypothetical protein
MAEQNGDVAKKTSGKGDNVSTKVNIAFPFSAIRVEDPSEELAELAELVRELAELLADVAPGSRASELGTRAEALVTKLK